MTAHALILSWLISALTGWTITPKADEDRVVMEKARGEVASEVMEVAYDEKEPPLYKGQDGRAKTAALLEVIATLETRIAAHIRADQCKSYECDSDGKGGHAAVGIMQIHPGTDGILLTPLGYRRCGPRDASCLHRSDLARNEGIAIRLALHMIRQNGLASYCGENPEGPVTELRRETTKKWLTKNPPPVLDEKVLAESETATR
jgi:hypothetical protein